MDAEASFVKEKKGRIMRLDCKIVRKERAAAWRESSKRGHRVKKELHNEERWVPGRREKSLREEDSMNG